MDNRRLILTLIFCFSLFMLWEGWMKHNQPPAPPPVATAGQDSGAGSAAPTTTLATPGEVPGALGASATASASAPTVTVRTDMVTAEVSALGGSIVRLELVHHKDSQDKTRGFVLLDNGTVHQYSAQSGLIGDGLPNHKTMFSLPEGEQVLKDGQDTLTLRLAAPPTADGLQVTKLLTFKRGSYEIQTGYEIANTGSAAVSPFAYFQFTRDGQAAESVQAMGVSTFTGPAVYTDAEKYQKVHFEDIADGKAKFAHKANNGWIAMVQHYFVSAWLPQGDAQREFYARKIGPDLYSSGVILPVGTVEPGQSASIDVPMYSGPQEQNNLKAIAPGLDLVVDYGWLTVIAAPLFWLLQWFHKLTGNWGWAIILVTIAIKAVFFPLSAASYKSMAKMRTLGPRLKRMKEQYGDDKVKMQQAMMELYKREKINPLGGCLPILVQIPVFIALYWVLLGSVEMRHAPWLGWIHDLSTKDPYYVLPILMGISMLIQTRLNPTPPDPIQAKVMMAMPIVFTFMFLFFPSGLVLYWVVNNTLSIAQQWQITKMIESGKEKAA
ncbi:MAG: membrane protein insertase YidC [Zoogloeaceae bacterium]|nr:membrane protein insertase YidC [Zoogloeaceae bacterium]MCP5241496.1 membrane protein insertase YidC [Zoogloeaceae bacterium]MCP5252921.1 membrane protein insertase YidC [Zoogloeaceae bacterium]MCP5293187.1 membrane protein insertase YidC [Zoogloeaceae bacterium]MCW5614100.1 membrane protein insertase YidC [Rhodocyclaceae bacterium]